MFSNAEKFSIQYTAIHNVGGDMAIIHNHNTYNDSEPVCVILKLPFFYRTASLFWSPCLVLPISLYPIWAPQKGGVGADLIEIPQQPNCASPPDSLIGPHMFHMATTRQLVDFLCQLIRSQQILLTPYLGLEPGAVDIIEVVTYHHNRHLLTAFVMQIVRSYVIANK